MDPKIAELARRLKAMTSSPNVHEAATAAAKLQELLFKYNLSEQQIPEAQRQSYKKDRIDLGEGRSVAWKRNLIFPIAKYNFCRAFYHHDVDSRGRLHRVPWMTIVGEPHNIEIVGYMMDFLGTEIIRLSDVFWRKEGFGNAGSWKQQFCYGAVQGVADVLREQFEKDRQAEVQTMALVVVKDKELDAYIAKSLGRTRPMNLSGAKQTDSYETGKEVGRNIQIRPGVKDSAPTLRLS